jgi:hypothetical protein
MPRPGVDLRWLPIRGRDEAGASFHPDQLGRETEKLASRPAKLSHQNIRISLLLMLPENLAGRLRWGGGDGECPEIV